MIWFFIIFIIVNIISYRIFIENSYYADGSDIFLYLICSICGTFIINIVIACIFSCYNFEETCTIIATEELKPYKKNIYIEEKMNDSELYYHYNNGKNREIELDDNVFISYSKVDKPIVKIYAYEYKNSILKYLMFNTSSNKYVFYIPKGGLKEYTNTIE